MKKLWIASLTVLLCVALCVLALNGCGKDASSSLPGTPVGAGAAGTPPGSDQADISVPSIGADTPDDSEEDGGDSDLSTQTTTVTGVISDAAMGVLYVELDGGGQTVGFAYEGADISGLTDSRPGNRVSVTYSGQLDGTDTSNITVLSIATVD